MQEPRQDEHERLREHHRAFSRSHVQMGAHWLKTAGILAPLVIHEFVKDPDKKWRYIRLASVATALVSEGMWQHRLQRERDDCRERGGR